MSNAGYLSYIGMRFNRLHIVSVFRDKSGKQTRTFAECICSCGNKTTALLSNIVKNHTTSCGCVHKEKISKISKTHGLSTKKIYGVWLSMKKRCTNSNCKQYKDYGGRGIDICPEWYSFEIFFQDMIEGYSENLCLDRINNNKGYSKDNCRWVTYSQNNWNKRNNIKVEINGEIITLKELSVILNIPVKVLQWRYKSGTSLILPYPYKKLSTSRK